jgi:hypothetical protein
MLCPFSSKFLRVVSSTCAATREQPLRCFARILKFMTSFVTSQQLVVFHFRVLLVQPSACRQEFVADFSELVMEATALGSGRAGLGCAQVTKSAMMFFKHYSTQRWSYIWAHRFQHHILRQLLLQLLCQARHRG